MAIGHYLLTLCPEAEDAILTGKLEPGSYGVEDVRCLVGWACGGQDVDQSGTLRGAERPQHTLTNWVYPHPTTGYKVYTEAVEDRFDNLCERFGTERIARVIRERILANRAWRTLKREPWPAGEVVE